MDKLISESIRNSINKLIMESEEDESYKDEKFVKDILFLAIENQGKIKVMPDWDRYEFYGDEDDNRSTTEIYEFDIDYNRWSFIVRMEIEVNVTNYSYESGDYWTPPSEEMDNDMLLVSDVDVEYYYDDAENDKYYHGNLTIGWKEFDSIFNKYFEVKTL